MKNRLEKKDSVGNRFDELAKILAGGLTRRKTLQLIGGSVLAVYLATGRAWGAATGSCKERVRLFSIRITWRPSMRAQRPAKIVNPAAVLRPSVVHSSVWAPRRAAGRMARAN